MYKSIRNYLLNFNLSRIKTMKNFNQLFNIIFNFVFSVVYIFSFIALPLFYARLILFPCNLYNCKYNKNLSYSKLGIATTLYI